MSATMELPSTKKCSKCCEVKGLGEFSRDSSRASGVYPSCKNCNKAKSSAFYQKNKEKLYAHQRRRRSLKANEIREYDRSYRERNKEKLKAYSRQWTESNRGKVNSRNKKWRDANPARAQKVQQDYRDRQKAMREFFKMHRAMHAIAETLNQMKP